MDIPEVMLLVPLDEQRSMGMDTRLGLKNERMEILQITTVELNSDLLRTPGYDMEEVGWEKIPVISARWDLMFLRARLSVI